jgi:hypothetical protein
MASMVTLLGGAGAFMGGCLDTGGYLAPGAMGSSSSSGAGSSSSTTGSGGAGGAGGMAASSSSSSGTGEMGGAGGAMASSSSSSSSGTGGMGGGGGGGPVVLQEWKAGQPAGAPPVYTLPSWLTIECPTDQRTSQTGINTLAMGYPPNAARPRSVGIAWGLSVESARTNVVLDSDTWTGTNWPINPNYGMAATPMQSDPAGTKLAVRFDSTGNQESSNNKTYANGGVASAWLYGAAGSAPYAHFHAGDKWIDVTDMKWTRYSLAAGAGPLFITTRDDPPGAGVINGNTSTVTFGMQLEQAVKYPSSYIPTGGAKVTRAADKLYSTFPSQILPGGYFDVEIHFAPNYASGEATAAQHTLLYIDNNNRLYIDYPSGAVVLKTGGQTLQSAAGATWKREQELVIIARNLQNKRELSLTGASTGNFSISDAQDQPTPTNKNVYILGTDMGAEECADLRQIAFYKPQ